jgi:hypothetical protein
MSQLINQTKLAMSKVESRHVRLGLAVFTLTLFVLGAGAPSSDCGNC